VARVGRGDGAVERRINEDLNGATGVHKLSADDQLGAAKEREPRLGWIDSMTGLTNL
jgi:hypothetical protein